MLRSGCNAPTVNVQLVMIDQFRGAGIWMVDLVAYYFVYSDAGNGEAWMLYSWLQLVGYALIILGQLIYNKKVQIPCVRYPLTQVTSSATLLESSPQRHDARSTAQMKDNNVLACVSNSCNGTA